jgi:hypothetical protein
LEKSINEQLRTMYVTNYDELKSKFNERLANDVIKATNPLLLSIDNEEAYRASDLKIMFFGQETNDWEGPFGQGIDHLLNTYQDYFREVKDHQHHRPFWNMVREYTKSVQQKNPHMKIDYVWNNILKVGRAENIGKPLPEIVALQQKYFPVIKAEIEILQPDVVVIFTGPNYDEHIKYEFPGAEFIKIQELKEREICAINSKYLPARTFRTYHPGYLVRGRQQLFEKLKDL